jgi:uncharacterized protein DUF5916
MLLPLLALLQAAPQPPRTYDGWQRQLEVRPPAIDAAITVDGILDEPVWQQAARLTGFSLYQPVDGQPAPDSTEVLVWHSATAIHFGIRAFEPHGAVRATLADRDRVSGDDNVDILLDTFKDRRRAFVFTVNPLGVQADGTKAEGGGFIPGGNFFNQTDLSPDFLWQSKGHVTDFGYEVEVRIPFTSLRYDAGKSHEWGIQIDRHVQHSGYEETWTPTKKGSASFIAQFGTITGLTDLKRGRVLEANPELTTRVPGTAGDDGAWHYDTKPDLGGNLRWAMSSNLTVNGTVRPDFSQVEADATQIATDTRFALFYPEKRPFFVDAIEQFNTPNTMVYTRQIVQPVAAAKLTGRVARTDVAVLSAIDDDIASRSGKDHPIFTIARLRRDVGAQSTAGLLFTDRTEHDDYNRVVGADTRIVFGGLYFASFQAVGSMTRRDGATHSDAMWEAVVDRTGRNFGFHYAIIGIGDDFRASSGFVSRTGYVRPSVANRFTILGRPGSVFEQWTGRFSLDGTWRYDDFFDGRSMLENKISADNNWTFRGGWSVNVTPTLASYDFDPAAYASQVVVVPPAGATPADTIPFVPSDRRGAFTLRTSISTPRYRHVSASLTAIGGRDIDFLETSSVRRLDLNASVNWRPTEKLRVDGSYVASRFERASDDVRSATTRIPRLKVEYQVARPLFVRFVGQYDARTRMATIDPRTGTPIYTTSSSGLIGGLDARTNALRADWLFSYRPSPGTVFFAGYGSSLTEPDALAFDGLKRVDDGFFLKLSYLFRL